MIINLFPNKFWTYENDVDTRLFGNHIMEYGQPIKLNLSNYNIDGSDEDNIYNFIDTILEASLYPESRRLEFI